MPETRNQLMDNPFQALSVVKPNLDHLLSGYCIAVARDLVTNFDTDEIEVLASQFETISDIYDEANRQGRSVLADDVPRALDEKSIELDPLLTKKEAKHLDDSLGPLIRCEMEECRAALLSDFVERWINNNEDARAIETTVGEVVAISKVFPTSGNRFQVDDITVRTRWETVVVHQEEILPPQMSQKYFSVGSKVLVIHQFNANRNYIFPLDLDSLVLDLCKTKQCF